MGTIIQLSRRRFLQVGAAAGGGLLIAVRFAAPARASAGGTMLGAWLRIGSDDTITMMIPSAEMGQGIFTALPLSQG